MRELSRPAGGGVIGRVLLLYGAYNLVHNLAFLGGYHLLPPGAMQGSHAARIASKVAAAPGFWSELGGTLFVNLIVMGSICVLLESWSPGFAKASPASRPPHPRRESG